MKLSFITRWIALVLVSTSGLPLLSAGIIGTTGNVDLLSTAPASVVAGALESNTLARVFEERTVTLASVVIVTNTATGDYPPNGNAGVPIPAGTQLTSFFLHFDTVGSQQGASLGSITFDRDIIGVITRGLQMDNITPIVGVATTSYGSSVNQGVEHAWLPPRPAFNADLLNISADRRVLTFDLSANEMDQLRVIITSATADPAPVPEPASSELMAVALVCLAVAAHRARSRPLKRI